MNILVLNYEYPPLGGGAGFITKNIAEQLSLRQHKITIVTTWYKGLPEYETVNGNLVIYRLKSKRKHEYKSNPLEMLSWASHTARFSGELLKNNKFDVCFANFAIPGGLVARKLFRRFSLPYCILSHGHDIPWYFKKQMFFYHLLTYFLIKSICKKSVLNFVQTGFMKKNIDRFTGKRYQGKNVIIPNGVNVSANNVFNKNNVPFTLIFAGRFVKQKSPMTMLKAVHRLMEMDIPFRLFLVGDGVMRPRMENFIRKNKIAGAVFTGWADRQAVNEYYNQAHVLIMPSLSEGMSIVNTEALAAGIYLVVTPVSGNKEILNVLNYGTIVEKENHFEIANAIQKFYFERYLPGKFAGEEGIRNFTRYFGWERIAEEYEKKLSEVLCF